MSHYRVFDDVSFVWFQIEAYKKGYYSFCSDARVCLGTDTLTRGCEHSKVASFRHPKYVLESDQSF